MVKKLTIKNFKSIKDLTLDCRRVNLFIGEPNTGKSNLLEGLALFCWPNSNNISNLVRFDDLSNLFFENDLYANEISIQLDSLVLKIVFKHDQYVFQFFQNETHVGDIYRSIEGSHLPNSTTVSDLSKVRPYFFKGVGKFTEKSFDFLFPPDGKNLFFLLQTNKKLQLLISEFIQERGFKLTFNQATSEIGISKEKNNIVINYPYSIISDTIQRIIFYVAAIETNQSGNTLIFEEPESNVFPYYTKYLAEKIAYSDKQYFLTTHNPYFLQSIIQKTRLEDLSVNIVYMSDYKTHVRPVIDQIEIEELIDLQSNVFLNLDKFLPE